MAVGNAMTADRTALELLATPVNTAAAWTSLYVTGSRAEIVIDLTRRPWRILARPRSIA